MGVPVTTEGNPDERDPLRALRTDLINNAHTTTARYAVAAFRYGVRAAMNGQAWLDAQAATAQVANDRPALTAAAERASAVFGAIQDAHDPESMASAIGGLLHLIAPDEEDTSDAR